MYFAKSTGGFYASEIHGNSIPTDAIEITAEEHAALLAGQVAGKLISSDENGRPLLIDQPPPTQAQLLAQLEAAVQSHLDSAAKSKGYDDIKSASLRAAYPGPFHDEGVAFATWMDSCWEKCYQVQASATTIPSADELVAQLPALVLPTSTTA